MKIKMRISKVNQKLFSININNLRMHCKLKQSVVETKKKFCNHNTISVVLQSVSSYYACSNFVFSSRISESSVEDIRRAIRARNDAQIIHNQDKFGPVRNDTIIIAIQVHNRTDYLRLLTGSLAVARSINTTLLVFSHDYYDEDINRLVTNINFTKVMQIYYPYSIQTHPNEFPGDDSIDCLKYGDSDDIYVRKRCKHILNRAYRSNERDAKYAQMKHHWWWKANRIFNQLECTAGHEGMVVFLEEDHYVAEDFIHMLSLLRSTADSSCPQCDILCLGVIAGAYHGDDIDKVYANLPVLRRVMISMATMKTLDLDRLQDYYDEKIDDVVTPVDFTRVEITEWHSNTHKIGYAFNITVWNRIIALRHEFCTYNDYNWDFSLLHLSSKMFINGSFHILLCKGPRVFHIGKCGVHYKKETVKDCNASKIIGRVQGMLSDAKDYLFPKRVAVSYAKRRKHRALKKHGGWIDER